MSDTVIRFTVRQRVEHALVMTLFTLLAVTGFPQKFADAGWARWIVDVVGGPERTRWIHRAAGVAFGILVALHVFIIVYEIATGRRRPTLVPARKDFTDAVTTLRYYLGLSDRQAAFDAFDYRQKFEYWGLLLGGTLMIVTGFVLMYPLQVTWLLPGEVIPASKVAHSSEGVLAFLIVITWHIYNAHLSPDVFPFDTSIFTGRISRERMRHEHPLELARMEPAPPPADAAGDG